MASCYSWTKIHLLAVAQKASCELTLLFSLIECFLQPTLPFSHVTPFCSQVSEPLPCLERCLSILFPLILRTGSFPFFRPWHEHPLLRAAIPDQTTTAASHTVHYVHSTFPIRRFSHFLMYLFVFSLSLSILLKYKFMWTKI